MENNLEEILKQKIRNIPDFPQKGVIFKDITPLLNDGEYFQKAIKAIAENYRGKNIDLIVASEARGFIIGSALAHELGVGFVPVRKAGKLPYKTLKHEYEKEYGKDSLEIHTDAIIVGQKILICDDVLATGGTINATKELVKKLGGDIVGFCFLIELLFLKGRDQFAGFDIFSLIQY